MSLPALLRAPRLGAAAPPMAHPLDASCQPASSFPAFRSAPYPLLLDSASPDGSAGRYSYLTADPFLVLQFRGTHGVVREGSQTSAVEGDPFTLLQELLQRFALPPSPGLPPFQGGAAGFFSYDLGRLLERVPVLARDDLGLPDLCLGFYDWVLAYDHLDGRATLVATGLPQGDEESARRRLAWALERLAALPAGDEPGPFQVGPLRSTFTRPDYLAAIRRVKEYLVQGEVYQVNLSQRFSAPFSGDSWALYRRLRQANPAPFAAYLEFPEATVLSASPEAFLKVEDGHVETRPIKGTRPRGRTPEEDRRLAQELLASEKERAENLMIVDLLRNDLGRVCSIGSVRVPSLFALERHPTVLHLVSTVTGELPPHLGAVDLLRACFPGGSVTGAPKIRAMEVIEELEPVRRGLYCGAIGFLGFDGAMNTSIAIRTMVLRQGLLTFSAGGAIVIDSDPEAEYEETLHKVRGLMRSLELEPRG